MKLLLVQFFQESCHFLSLISKYISIPSFKISTAEIFLSIWEQVLHPYKTTGRIMDVFTSVYYLRRLGTRLLCSEQYSTTHLCIRVRWAAAELAFFPPFCRADGRTLRRECELCCAVPSRSFEVTDVTGLML